MHYIWIKRELSLPLAVALCRYLISRLAHSIQDKPIKMHFVNPCEGSGVGDQPRTSQDALSWKGQSFLLHSSIQSAELHSYLLLPLPHSSVQLTISISPGAPAPGLPSSRPPLLPHPPQSGLSFPSHTRDFPLLSYLSPAEESPRNSSL